MNPSKVRNSKRQTSLEAKICLLTMGLLFVLLLGVGHFAMNEQRKALSVQKAEAFHSAAVAWAAYFEVLAETNPKGIVRQMSERLTTSANELEYIIIQDSQGKQIFAESRHFTRFEPPALSDTTCRMVRNIAGFGGLYNAKLHRETIPVTLPDGSRGKLIAAFTYSQLNDLIDDLDSKMLLVFAVAFMVGVALSMMLARSLVKPLCKLISGARKVAAGDLSIQLEVSNDDEIGDLANTFNYMVEEMRKSRDQLLTQAMTDSLTGLNNHRAFQERLNIEMTRAERFSHDLSLLMMDIDHFKTFNDTYGHPAGDEALREIGRLILANIRQIDFAARYGGEEFAVILPETALEEANEIAERIRLSIANHSFFGSDGAQYSMTVSIGAAQFPLSASELGGLVLAADMALYKAKAIGRNAVCVFEDSSISTQSCKLIPNLMLNLTEQSMIEAVSGSIDSIEGLPEGYSIELSRLAAKIAERLNLNPEEQDAVRLSALLRDIACLVVPCSLDEKRDLAVNHPIIGASIIQKAPHLKSLIKGIMHHHEKYDGTGFPRGLAGIDISITGRIIAAAEAAAQYKLNHPETSIQSLREQLDSLSGTVLDPEVASALSSILEEGTSEGHELAA